MFFGIKARQAMKTKCLILCTVPGKNGTQVIIEDYDEEEQAAVRKEIEKAGGQITQFNTSWGWYQGGMNVVPNYTKP
jgi:uncharacterized protein with GYD domain